MCANCHVVSVNIEFNSLEAIKRACKRKGWEFRENQKTYQWVGRWYDDSKVPRQLFETEDEYNRVCAMTGDERKRHMPTILGKCTHAITIKGAIGEIGLIQRGNKFIPIWDYFTPGLYSVHEENGMNGFLQAYAIERAKLTAQYNGQCYQEFLCEGGAIKLKVQINE